LPEASQVVGARGVTAIFHEARQSTFLVEYAVRTRSVFKSFEHADYELAFNSCTDRSSSTVTESLSDGRLIGVSSLGDWSIGIVRNVMSRGVKSQLGYVLIRKKDLLVVVGYQNPGQLKKRTLERYAKMAYRKLTS
jgi:hypothetical protein